MVWIEPVYPRIFGILKNPTHAGVFVWGRNHTRTSIVEGRARKTRGHARPLEQWEVTIPNHHEGYITWEEFMRNQQQIRSNAGWNARMGSANGAVRNGPALLTGLLRCGRCGRSLQVCYVRSKQHGMLPRYWCAGDRGQQMVRSCITLAGRRVDQLVAIEVLEALRPLGVQAALDALDHTENQTDEKRRSLELAAELEKRWNNALTHVTEMERRLEEARVLAPQLTAEQRQQLLALGDDLKQLWDHPRSPVN